MTVSIFELAIYSGGIVLLFLTPGPVWLAIVARTLSGGVISILPLATGVLVGDIVWPLLAIIGSNWLYSNLSDAIIILRLVASVTFVLMGIHLIKHSKKPLNDHKSLTKPGTMAGFFAGLAVILANPKAILFYIGVLPGFFNLASVTYVDIFIILAISSLIPFLGNLTLSFFVDKVRIFLQSNQAVRRNNILSGSLLILVGLLIVFTH